LEKIPETAKRLTDMGPEFIRAKLEEARKHLGGIRQAQHHLEEIATSIGGQIRELEEAERATSFQANATMLRDLFYPFAMTPDAQISYIARKGDRVHAVPGRYDFSPVLITTAEGKQHEVDGEAVQLDAAPAASQAV
jgi:hypothetical protein